MKTSEDLEGSQCDGTGHLGPSVTSGRRASPGIARDSSCRGDVDAAPQL